MAYRTNISIFLPNGPPNPLLDAYRILVAIELALKDVGFNGGTSGHDIPSMLTQAATQAATLHPMVASQLIAHQAKLKADLCQLTCNNKMIQPASVSANNYPHARYTRFTGDWNGIGETPHQSIVVLAQTCNGLLAHLQTHKAILGINL